MSKVMINRIKVEIRWGLVDLQKERRTALIAAVVTDQIDVRQLAKREKI